MKKNKPISTVISSNIPFRSTLINASPWILVVTETRNRLLRGTNVCTLSKSSRDCLWCFNCLRGEITALDFTAPLICSCLSKRYFNSNAGGWSSLDQNLTPKASTVTFTSPDRQTATTYEIAPGCIKKSQNRQ